QTRSVRAIESTNCTIFGQFSAKNLIQREHTGLTRFRCCPLPYRLWLQECRVEYLSHMDDKDEFQVFQYFLRHVVEVAAVSLRHNDRFQLRTPCCEQLFFDSSDGQHVAP